jgi:hypothetical protein
MKSICYDSDNPEQFDEGLINWANADATRNDRAS